MSFIQKGTKVSRSTLWHVSKMHCGRTSPEYGGAEETALLMSFPVLCIQNFSRMFCVDMSADETTAEALDFSWLCFSVNEAVISSVDFFVTCLT